MNPKRRTRLLVDRDLQVRFLVIVALAAASAVFLSTGLTAWSLARLAAELPEDGNRMLARLPALLSWNALLALGLTVPWLMFLALAGTHRIFGPLVRFRHFLHAVADGRQPEPCRIRDGDHLQDVCDLLNVATEPLRATQRATKASELKSQKAA